MCSLEVKEISLEDEYRKPNGIVPDDIKHLRQWLKTQPHLPENLITDLDLILIYHCCEKSSAVSKQVLDLHFTLKTLFSNFFKDRLVDDKVEKVLKNVLLTILPEKTKEGYKTIYTHFLNYDSKYFNYCDTIRTVFMVLDLFQYEEGTWPGCVMVVDLEGMTLGHLAKLDLQSLQQFLYFLQEAMLVKLKGLHFLNAPSFMDRLLMLIKPFMKNTLMDILHIHQVGSQTIEAHVPIKALPKEAGGSYKNLKECGENVAEKLRANAKFFFAENKKRVNESARPGRAKTISDIFQGVEGSFKKLDID